MSESSLPTALEEIFAADSNPEILFSELLKAIGEVMQCDRCFLLVRHPQTRIYRNFCWRRNLDLPNTETDGWQSEEEWEKEDPMFAAALRTAPPIFISDIETAPPEVLNVEFERNFLGHRALVHAHIVSDEQLWGILQPCMFGQPREWTQCDRAIISSVIERLRQPVVDYVKSNSDE
ncbi:GAF domain-containing protein [Chroococcus sp. FPU101]|uniref:GAF domain-containing protein n=1 Tax=Chroococcus sp. FPU101 TaxID=1974212 RepID=UPI001A8CC9C8|nr:GAF domain-containing protein [Chroococcus sp. FPU101]GFE67979.1 hypothetical protein CFPU101_05890 [Chroococcus sp. FPU101]